MKRFLYANSFILGILGVILLAGLFPAWGGASSPLPVKAIRSVGIFLIFFNQGVQLPAEELRKGLVNWRLHLLVQGAVFLLFPLVTALALHLAGGLLGHPDLRRGFLYLSFVPTTITSAVAMTSMAGGSVSGALFNCALSSLLGVFLTPALSVAFLDIGADGGTLSAGDMMGGIAMTLLFPLVLGQALRRWLKGFYHRHAALFRRLNTGIVLFIVWEAFCQSFLRGVWSRVEPAALAAAFAGVFLMLGGMGALVWRLSGLMGLPRPVRIAAFYAGSEKTLAMGLPLSALIFPPGRELSLILLPLLIYHPAQLLLGGWLIPRFQGK